MKKLVLLLLVTVTVTQVNAQNTDSTSTVSPLMASLNTLTAVRFISIGDRAGTCFIVNFRGKQYLITVRHIFENLKKKNGDTVNFAISDKKGMLLFNSSVFFHSNSEIDIAVIYIPDNFLPNNQLRLPETERCSLGQDCFFLGYPLGLSTFIDSTNYPLYKKAVLSGMLNLETGLIVFDAHNNKGFSGAPIITTNSTYKNQYVVGVVSGYKIETRNVEVNNKEKNNTVTLRENSGIMEAFDTRKVIEIIIQNKLL